MFPRLAREGRKFNVGLRAVTQQPKLIDAELLSQFNTYFVLGLADERDRNTSALLQAGPVRPGGRDPDPDAGRGPGHQPRGPLRPAGRVHLYEDWLATVPAPEPPRERPAEAMSGFYE